MRKRTIFITVKWEDQVKSLEGGEKDSRWEEGAE